ncbi:phospholipase A2 [Metarhizium album ARSEF 1941]|uniref:Putative phospholipase n=1 Tax=Metarhizium album (strain ARSEF 1941) TaxID=1081103 RepID=A0A0B2WNC2_METAS|nr:phospholipase A2 [Metarhizium album ARSEF 1941]KHN94987.1 phospholipase A2 [Metarhizium album ARSEF 1941]
MAAADATAASKLASYFARLSPVPVFPEYTGPYKVGTVDVEIPTTDLHSPSPAPANAVDIPTVQFRVFYPAAPASDEKRITWLPNPQRHHVSAYTKFVGVGSTLAEILSFLPRHLHYTTIPAHKNAEAADSETKRWPTMIFSHGLGGGRNSYSYIAGSLASHGVVVFCPEHRDGSAVISFIRLANSPGRFFSSAARRIVPYNRIAHQVAPGVYEAREDQLRVRLWELGLIHDAILAIDEGRKFTNMNLTTPTLRQFIGRLDVHDPGRIVFGGHSFGAATVHQFLKCNYYADLPQVAAMKNPLFTPAKDSSIRKQITEKTVTMLLDMWCLPLLAPNSKPLYDLPLPVYADVPSAPGGTALLAVESETFHNWTEHLHVKAKLLSPDPTSKTVSPQLFERPSGRKLPEPNFFYVVNSAHLSQSDFGILFPWLTKKIFDAEQPERALRLNLRAQLQLLRANGIPVARTYAGDLIDGVHVDKLSAKDGQVLSTEEGTSDDKAIFDRSASDGVDHWKWIDLIGLGDFEGENFGKTVEQRVEEAEEQMQGELEPSENEAVQPVVQALSAAA